MTSSSWYIWATPNAQDAKDYDAKDYDAKDYDAKYKYANDYDAKA